MKPAFPRSKDIVAIITYAERARGLSPLVRERRPPLPPVSYGPGALYREKGFRKTMNTVFYAMIYIVAAALVVTAVFLGIPALTP
jgi:hypothetical protein